MHHQIENLERRTLLAFGDLDTAFGTGGLAILQSADPGHQGQVSAQRVAVLADGRIALAADDLIIVRKADGMIDKSFDFDGLKGLAPYNIRGVRQTAGGKLVVATEQRISETDTDVTAFFRLDLAGRIDRSFGVNGIATAIEFRSQDTGRFLDAWDVNSAGEIVFVARTVKRLFETDPGPQVVYQSVGKLTSAGVLDPTFAGGTPHSDGLVQLDYERFVPPARVSKSDRRFHIVDEVIIDPAGRALLVGSAGWRFVKPPAFDHSGAHSTYVQVEQYAAVVALTAQGLLDADFGVGGIVHVGLSDVADSTRSEDIATTADLRTSDLRLLIAVAGDFSGKTRIVEVDPDGAAHLSRLSNGLVTGTSQIEWLADGRAVLLGDDQGFPSAASEFVLASRDPSGDWLASSPAIHPEPKGVSSASIFAMRAAAQNKILFAGAWVKFGPDPQSQDDDSSVQFIRLDAGAVDESRPDVFIDGRDNDIAFDSQGNLHAVYYDVRARRLLYKVRNSKGRWGPAYEIDRGPSVGLLPDIEVDAKDLPSVAYYDGNAADLKFAARDKKFRWTVQVVDARKAVGQEPALKIPPSGLPAIAYYARTAGDLRLAQLDRADQWVIQTVDSEGDTGRFASLKLSEEGRWVIAAARADGAVRLAEPNVAGAWALSTAAVASGRASHVQLLPDSSSRDIVFYDDGPDDLLLARRDTTSGLWSNHTLSSRGNTGRHVLAAQRGTPGPELFWWDASRNIVTGGMLAPQSASFPTGVSTALFAAGDQLSFAYQPLRDLFAFVALNVAGNLIVTDG